MNEQGSKIYAPRCTPYKQISHHPEMQALLVKNFCVRGATIVALRIAVDSNIGLKTGRA